MRKIADGETVLFPSEQTVRHYEESVRESRKSGKDLSEYGFDYECLSFCEDYCVTDKRVCTPTATYLISDIRYVQKITNYYEWSVPVNLAGCVLALIGLLVGCYYNVTQDISSMEFFLFLIPGLLLMILAGYMGNKEEKYGTLTINKLQINYGSDTHTIGEIRRRDRNSNYALSRLMSQMKDAIGEAMAAREKDN